MPRSVSNMLIAYGLFLGFCGILGYVLTGEGSTSSILNGGVFGSLMALLGLLGRNGKMWTFPAAISATAIFTLTFLWRSGVQLHLTVQGEVGRWPVAALLILMTGASAIVVTSMLRSYRH